MWEDTEITMLGSAGNVTELYAVQQWLDEYVVVQQENDGYPDVFRPGN